MQLQKKEKRLLKTGKSEQRCEIMEKGMKKCQKSENIIVAW